MKHALRLIFLACTVLPSFTQAAVTVTVNGASHTIPQTNEKGWGANVTAWIQAISQYTLQNSGGTFTLTAEVDTGATYGFKVPYIKTQTSTPATAGVVRLAKTDSVGFRNNTNSSDLLLSINGADQLTFNGVVLGTASAGSFSDSGFIVFNNSDNTKKIALDASAITTGTTRTLKMADAAVDLANLSASTLTAGTLPAARLPNPSASTLGGIQSAAAVSNQWIASISTSGVPALSQPAFSNISGTASLTTQVTGTLPIANGGTNNGSLGVDAGGIYYSDGSKLVNLAHGTSGNVLTSGGTSAPTWTSPLVNPMTTGGDIIYGGASGAATRLANGSSGQTLLSAGSTNAPTWGTLTIAGGGTGQVTKSAAFDALQPMTTGGDIIYGGASGTGTRLANGTSGYHLTSAGGTAAPTWSEDSVISHNTNGTTYNTENVERATISNNGTCSVSLQSGTWISGIAHPGTGRCNITIAAGIFSGTPSCTCVARTTAAPGQCAIDTSGAISNVSFYFVTATGVGTATDMPFDIHCMGPK